MSTSQQSRRQIQAKDPEVQRDLAQLLAALLGPDDAVRAAALANIRAQASANILHWLFAQLIHRWRKALPAQRATIIEVLRALNPAAVDALKLKLLSTKKATIRADLVALLSAVSSPGDVRVVLGLRDMSNCAREQPCVRAAARQALEVVSPVPLEQLDDWLDSQPCHWTDRMLIATSSSLDREASVGPA